MTIFKTYGKHLLIIMLFAPFAVNANYVNDPSNCENSFAVLYPQYDDTIANYFFAQVKFTTSGLKFFFDKVYNTRAYARDLLPYDMSHLIQFVSYGEQNRQPEEYTNSALNIFHRKLKEAEFVTIQACSDMMDKLRGPLASLIGRYKVEAVEEKRSSFSKMMHDALTSDFDLFKAAPTKFLDGLAGKMAETTSSDKFAMAGGLEVRRNTTSMLETTIGKLVWDPHDGTEAWESARNIAAMVLSMRDAGTILMNEADNLLWSLVYRVKHLLDITGQDMSTEFCEHAKNDILSGQSPLTAINDPEKLAESKAEVLVQALCETEALVMANKIQIPSDPQTPESETEMKQTSEAN